MPDEIIAEIHLNSSDDELLDLTDLDQQNPDVLEEDEKDIKQDQYDLEEDEKHKQEANKQERQSSSYSPTELDQSSEVFSQIKAAVIEYVEQQNNQENPILTITENNTSKLQIQINIPSITTDNKVSLPGVVNIVKNNNKILFSSTPDPESMHLLIESIKIASKIAQNKKLIIYPSKNIHSATELYLIAKEQGLKVATKNTPKGLWFKHKIKKEIKNQRKSIPHSTFSSKKQRPR